VPEDWQEKAFKKASIENWSEMDADKIEACITWLKGRIET
jgi:hypothetical protein